MNTKLYFIKHIALVALFALGFMLVPTVGTALAQKTFEKEVATSEMLSYALNLGSVSDVAVYSENGVSGKGDATLTNGYRSADGSEANRKDLAKAFSSMNQLPCKEVADTDLSGKTFTPGVYCLGSAELSSRLIMDGEGNPNAIFVFRVAGGLNAKSGASVGLENGAQAGSVFFVSNDSARLEAGVDFKGSIFARNNIVVGDDTTVDGRVMSVKGDVSLSGNALLGPQQTGVLEICKELDTTFGTGLEQRIFRFSVAGIIAEVPVGMCSGPLVVPTGPQTITELQTGRTLQGGTFNGNFQLVQVRTLGQTPTNSLVSANLPNFTANVVIREGGIANQIRIEFTNRFAITAIVEICKEALDSGVTGFFNFTINGLNSGSTNTNTAGVIGTTGTNAGNVGGTPNPFTVPVGQCTGAIAVVVGSDAAGTGTAAPRRQGTVTVNELPRTGFIFTSASTAPGTVAPTNRLVNFNVLANGGGNATVVVVAGTTGPTGGADATGATANQTTVFFNNRTAPAALKICKIAFPGNSVNPGIPVGSNFNFTVTGTNPNAPVTGSTTVAGGGTAQTGSTLQGGTVSTVNVDVIAGPVENGGFCNDVPGLFVVDTTATITENPATANFGEVRVSRIRSSSGSTAPLSRPGEPFFPANTGAASTRTVTVPIAREVTEVEFVNIAFFPVPLKICKVAGSAALQNQPFTFTVTPDTAGGLLASFSNTVTVLAGPQAPAGSTQQNGFCDFVGGPFGGTFGGGTATINGLGSFNLGSTVTIQETGFGSTTIQPGGITSPTGGVVANTTTRTAVITNMINGVNEVQFVNTSTTAPILKERNKRIRFF
jgi:hypothetical protein